MTMKPLTTIRRIFEPLRSRKVRIALATVVAAFAAEYSLDVSEEMILTIMAAGIAVILGIAHEDAGAKSAPAPHPSTNPTETSLPS